MSKIKTKKSNLTIIVIAIIFIFFLTIGVGYSYLQQKMNIYGKSTIVTDESGKYINGNSTYSYQIVNSEMQSGTNNIIYDVKLKITNMDKDISSWEISFDAPEGYDDFNSNIKDGISKKYENGRITINARENEGYLSKGSALEIEMQLAINGELHIDNLTMNGRLAINVN